MNGLDPLDLFSKFSNYGRNANSVLLESADPDITKGKLSFGTSDPCIRCIGKRNSFNIKALNEMGDKFLRYVLPTLNFCDKVDYSSGEISGILRPQRANVSETERLKLKTHMDIVRRIAFAFSSQIQKRKDAGFTSGLIGAFSYDFIDQFEDLQKNKGDLTDDPDYVMYFADNLFRFDHRSNTLYLVSNILVTDEDRRKQVESSLEKILNMERLISSSSPIPRVFGPKKIHITTDTPKKDYCEMVLKMKEHILMGDVFQIVPSRTVISDFNSEPLDVYRNLRAINPSPYMFFLNYGEGVLLGASPEKYISVNRTDQGQRKVEIHPIAGTKPRGFRKGSIDSDLDNRYEIELRLDPKEIAEHTMLVDLARNDVAKISIPGTRRVDDPFKVVKYSHVQHLVSNVSGLLKPEYDALHAYLASMNMGTLTGAPKVMAMDLLRKYEPNKRGFYGGSVFYLTPDGDFDSTIVIRSLNIKDGKAYLRAGAGVVYDSIPEKEFEETEKKLSATERALRETWGRS